MARTGWVLGQDPDAAPPFYPVSGVCSRGGPQASQSLRTLDAAPPAHDHPVRQDTRNSYSLHLMQAEANLCRRCNGATCHDSPAATRCHHWRWTSRSLCPEALLKKPDLVLTIDIFNRFPTPFGLVRDGVAPDHQSIKAVARVLDRTLADPRVRF